MVDTHVVLWLAFTPAKLSRAANSAINGTREDGESLGISDMSLLEIALLKQKGKIHLDSSLESFLAEIETKFSVLPITSQVCARILEFPAAYPKDPADRIIGATALVNGCPLITADQAIRRSKALQTIW